MITREQLKQIPYIDRQISSKMNQIRELREHIMCVKSVDITADKVQSSKDSDPMKLVDQLIDMEANINADIDRLIALRTDAADLFRGLESTRDMVLMELRYLEGLTWEIVAARMNYSVQHVHKLHGKILQDCFPCRKGD